MGHVCGYGLHLLDANIHVWISGVNSAPLVAFLPLVEIGRRYARMVLGLHKTVTQSLSCKSLSMVTKKLKELIHI